MGKTSLNHIRKFYCKHVLYRPGKVHCLNLECLKFQLFSSLPPQSKREAFNSIFVMNFIWILMIKWWKVYSIWIFLLLILYENKILLSCIRFVYPIPGLFGLEGSRRSFNLLIKEIAFYLMQKIKWNNPCKANVCFHKNKDLIMVFQNIYFTDYPNLSA